MSQAAIAEAAPQLEANLLGLWDYLTDDEKRYVEELLRGAELWSAVSTPQYMALTCRANELFYGGAAGGGKTDLLIGLALTEHTKSIIYRREATQLIGIIERMVEILGDREGFNSQTRVWKPPAAPGKTIELGAVKDLGDEQKYQGRPHDLKGFDEITHFLRLQYTYLNGWKRTANPDQRVRTVATGNPPTTPEGRWVIGYWAPWLDKQHPLYNKVEPGELAYVWTDADNNEHWQLTADPIEYAGRTIVPRSRTFIPSSVEDNPFYMTTDYVNQLESLPEPLRSQLRDGNFQATSDDDRMQAIPTAWIEAAMDRWEDKDDQPKGEMDSMGVDPARGGRDQSIIARRHGRWFDKPLEYPGGATPDGPTVAGLVVAARRDDCPVHVDVIGVGASVVDFLSTGGVHTIPVVGSAAAPGLDEASQISFANFRSWLVWHMRDALDPQYDHQIQLPPDDELLADLAAPRIKNFTRQGLSIESKEDIIKRLGRSPDKGDAYNYALLATMKRRTARRVFGGKRRDIGDYDPYAED